MVSVLACVLVLAMWATFERVDPRGQVLIFSGRPVRFDRDAAELVRITHVPLIVGEQRLPGMNADPVMGQLFTSERLARLPFWAMVAGSMVLPGCWMIV